jgi:hypothetical protein
MKAATKSVDLAQVLNLVNVGRAAFGRTRLRKLPKGLRGDWYECPLGRAFKTPIMLDGNDRSFTLVADRDDAVGLAAALGVPRPHRVELTARGEELHHVILPQALNQFVLDFTDGLLPELVLAEQ